MKDPIICYPQEKICTPDIQFKYDTNNSKVKIEKNIQNSRACACINIRLNGDEQGGLACYDSWGRKESDMTEQLN